ncbi:MAG: TetR/AcrR family transcriptional regulator [Pseudomonadales bacterium]|jgi:AcrR family transcriptional regulator|nr:TetR/AcrR family transcriptional regulator [Pseudomonadales bacterium]MDP6470517.1 TetR/AcrR family transcriptional regulator [Pseudomonadales bacterium]MDP6827819.1 TetR/AcrR family transcriptional regulator [Pseudomonadales bacterium]MDP6972991.1 TetR/AcrR family transcriptional regulator [Pseudomonadales bacterium]|tara:strand:+ start:368 stop:973 length:606 start_codon:yes stop_codon:yes gene_type:complete
MPRSRANSRERAATTARKESILSTALECFAEHGVEATTISDIQARAHCSVGSIYHHFGSKEGVAEALFISGIERLNRGMLRRLGGCQSGQECVKSVVYFYSDWSARNQKLARYLHSRDVEFSPAARERLKSIHLAYITEIYRLFAPFVENGELRVLPLETYVPLISGAIQEYTRRWLSGQGSSPARVKELFADAAWNAVKA